jgi:3-methylfumaryl-CoA hydratase
MSLLSWEKRARQTIVKQLDTPNENLIRLFNLNLRLDSAAIRPGTHFTMFPNITNDLSPDGYDHLWTPPEPFRNRMWKGGKLEFFEPMHYQSYSMVSTLIDVQFKNTSRGEACFTTLQKDIASQDSLILRETRTLAYLSQPFTQQKWIKKNSKPEISRTVIPNALMLFRFSATTFNSHFIHYDREYCQKEGYQKPLVHGPLTVSLLLDHFMESTGKQVASFEYACVAPAFQDGPLHLHLCSQGDAYSMWATNDEDGLVVKGTIIAAPSCSAPRQ